MTIRSAKKGTGSNPHRGIAWNSVYKLVSVGSRRGLMSIVLLCFATVLSIQEYAWITVAISLAGVFAVLANWGYVATLTRYVSGTITRSGRYQTQRLARGLFHFVQTTREQPRQRDKALENSGIPTRMPAIGDFQGTVRQLSSGPPDGFGGWSKRLQLGEPPAMEDQMSQADCQYWSRVKPAPSEYGL